MSSDFFGSIPLHMKSSLLCETYDEIPVKRDGSKAKCSQPRFMTLVFAKFAALLDAQSANSAPCRPRKVLDRRQIGLE
jgi:hypothetical protein